MQTAIYILLHVIAFPFTYFIVSRGVILFEKAGLVINPKHHDNKFVFSLLILSIFIVYFSLSSLIGYLMGIVF